MSLAYPRIYSKVHLVPTENFLVACFKSELKRVGASCLPALDHGSPVFLFPLAGWHNR